MKNTFSESEINYVESIDENLKDRAFFEIWTIKEAYLKMLGTGIIDHLNAIDTLALPAVYFNTYCRNNYMITSCSNLSEDIRHHILTEKDIYDFYNDRQDI